MRTLLFLSRLTVLLLVFSALSGLFRSPVFPAQKAVYPIFNDFPLPESLSLCKEPMPLKNRHVWEMLDREFNISVWDRAQVFLWLKRAGRYFPYIEKRLAEAGMPGDLKYLAVAESSLLIQIRSGKGAVGPWQFMTHTARRNGLRKDRRVDERQDFERSTEAALKYLKRLKDIFGTWTLALAAYNCGETRMKKEIKRQKVKDYYSLKLPQETERFVFRIAAIKIIMENPKRYGYSLTPERIYRPINCDSVPIKLPVPLPITDVARALGTTFKVLKDLNPQILGYFLPTGHYTLRVPTGSGSGIDNVLKQLNRTASPRMEKVSDGYYVVQPGDTLSHIAKRTGVPLSTLKNLNGIQGSLIRVGQKLRLTH